MDQQPVNPQPFVSRLVSRGVARAGSVWLLSSLALGQATNESDFLSESRELVRQGDIHLKAGDPETAREFFRGTIDVAAPIFGDLRNGPGGKYWGDLPAASKQQRFSIVELAMPGMLRTSRALGEPSIGIEYGLFMINLQRAEGLKLSTAGREAMLEVAEMLMTADGFVGSHGTPIEAQWFSSQEAVEASNVPPMSRRSALEFALSLMRDVANTAKDKVVAVDAENLLSESCKTAIERCYAALRYQDEKTKAERGSHAPAIYVELGTALHYAGRDLEAAMAFREALLQRRKPDLDDTVIRKYRHTLRGFCRAAPGAGDQTVAPLNLEASRFGWFPRETIDGHFPRRSTGR